MKTLKADIREIIVGCVPAVDISILSVWIDWKKKAVKFANTEQVA
jgi:hypothetical protein